MSETIKVTLTRVQAEAITALASRYPIDIEAINGAYAIRQELERTQPIKEGDQVLCMSNNVIFTVKWTDGAYAVVRSPDFEKPFFMDVHTLERHIG